MDGFESELEVFDFSLAFLEEPLELSILSSKSKVVKERMCLRHAESTNPLESSPAEPPPRDC